MSDERRGYEEHHFLNIMDIGIAFNEDRVWVCFDGVAVFRAKAVPSSEWGKLMVEYNPPNQAAHDRKVLEAAWRRLSPEDRSDMLETLKDI